MHDRIDYARRHPWRIAIVVSCLAAGLIVAIVGSHAQSEEPVAIASAKTLSRAFRSAAKQMMPAVVKIKATTRLRNSGTEQGEPPHGSNPFQGTPLEDFFRNTPGVESRRFEQREGTGSGVIIDTSGIVLTNEHVVDGADEVVVELSDGRQLRAIKIDSDEQSDLAIVRIKADGSLPAAALGDSDKVEIGDWVLAIGTPFGLDLSVSAGIISGKARTLPSGHRAEFLQTDAAINPGNSGGPLVNLDGEVIGINTAIASETGGYQGVGFAIPSNLVKWVTNQLIKRGTVQRAYLGVLLEEIDAALGEQFGVAPGRGVLVVEVVPDTPAARAGVRVGDIILGYAGREVHSVRPLQEVIEQSPPGTAQRLALLRDGKPLALQVAATTALPVAAATALPSATKVRASAGSRRNKDLPIATFTSQELGLAGCDLSKELAERLGFEGLSGVVVTAVDDGGVAADAGVRERALIVRIGKQPIRNCDDLVAAIKLESVHNGIMLLVRTPDGANQFVVLRQ